MKAISRGRDMLIKDNLSLQQEREGLWQLMGNLGGDAVLLSSIDAELTRRIEEVRATDPERATALTSDALLPVRQRHQDILTQITVSVQSYISMGLIIDTNKQLVRGADGAQTTTMAALRNAIIVAEALNNSGWCCADRRAEQHDELDDPEDQRDAARQLREDPRAASSSGISMDVLRQSFDNIYAHDGQRGPVPRAGGREPGRHLPGAGGADHPGPPVPGTLAVPRTPRRSAAASTPGR